MPRYINQTSGWECAETAGIVRIKMNRKEQLGQAITELAKVLEYDNLIVSSEPASFINAATKEILDLRKKNEELKEMIREACDFSDSKCFPGENRLKKWKDSLF